MYNTRGHFMNADLLPLGQSHFCNIMVKLIKKSIILKQGGVPLKFNNNVLILSNENGYSILLHRRS